ncbi:MAG: pyrimidine-nucleoside phosphorylase, partial [Moorella sp. (in: Bacteria)]|nr:pyrimidine-nucleoside phosphorylase [Moorella sp. (in: firmicutes)]
MRMSDIILKKREGQELSPEEIKFFVRGYTEGNIPDYQAAALLMAVFFRGLSPLETAELTLAMVESGEKIDLSAIAGCKVDKHSTGGVGDKTTLVLAPLVAAAGAPVAKLAGRGLGHTGGTIDKLEAIPGLQTELSIPAFIQQVKEIGVAVAAQTRDLVPADKKIYALRDVTATVECIPLIASSIMSKKLAAGADAVVLDVKVGAGAFLPRREDARALARTMAAIGRQLGRTTVCFLTDMEQPLGRAVGNALEVREAITALKGEGPGDLEELCLALGAQMLVLAKKAAGIDQARQKLTTLLKNGGALRKFQEMVAAQGGNPEVVENTELLKVAGRQEKVLAQAAGYVQSVDGRALGRAAVYLGAGRQSKEDQIDLSVGLVMHKKIGDTVEAGEPLVTMFVQQARYLEDARKLIAGAYKIGEEKPAPRPMV